MPSKILSRKEYEELKKLQERSGAELSDLLPEGESETCSLSAIGASYMLGELPLHGATLETFALLSSIRSPFIVEDSDEDPTNIATVAKTVFVLAMPAEAVQPIMALAQRRRAVRSTEKIAEKGPDFYEVYLKRLDHLSQIEAEFEAESLSLYSQSGSVRIEDAIEIIRQIVVDAMDGFTLLPEQSSQKKTAADSASKT